MELKRDILNTLLDSDLYDNPLANLQSLFANPAIQEYINAVVASDDVKSVEFQEKMKEILDGLIADGKKEEAGLMFNVHRVLTEYSGYGANEAASSDVVTAFSDEITIPESGLIVIDFFATRNLAKVVELCERKGVDLKRIRVCVPQAVLAAQLVKLNDVKRAEFEAVCAKLDVSQFIIPNVAHNADIQLPEKVAVWFSPRTMAITPVLHGLTETEAVTNFTSFFSSRIAEVVDGGTVYAPVAFSEEFEPLSTGANVSLDKRSKRALVKISGISKVVGTAIAELFIKLGFKQVGAEVFDPASVSVEVDHAKIAQNLHMINQN